jgi:predicted metal-dependent enzyme (double-stranded beta helix superfamily)
VLSAVTSRPAPFVPAFSVLNGVAANRPKAERLAQKGKSTRRLRIEDLEVIATGLAQSSRATDQVWIPGTRRRYRRLLGTDLYDAWLIEWSPSSGLELHDHGGSRGVVVVVAGTLVETYTDLDNCHPLVSQSLTGGETLAIPPTRVHEVSNPGPGDALSVHVYSPPLREMTFFEHRSESFPTSLHTTQGDLAVLER